MARAFIRLYEELNEYLPADRRKRTLAVAFERPCPVRHLIERLGVPHTEIELVLLNGASVNLEARVGDGDRIAVYPVFEAIDVSPMVRLRAAPLREPRFFADAQLGRLARYLRLLGFDTLYENAVPDAELTRRAAEQRRIILTRDRALLLRRDVTHGCHIHFDDPMAQLAQVVTRCDLARSARPFSRCLACNATLAAVDKDAIAHRLDPLTARYYDEFWQCPGCARIYWQGSHFARLQALVSRALDDAR